MTPTCAVCAGDRSTQTHPCKPPLCKAGPRCQHPPFMCRSCGTPHKATDPNCPMRALMENSVMYRILYGPSTEEPEEPEEWKKPTPTPTNNQSTASSQRTNQDTDTTNYRNNFPRVNRSSSDTPASGTGQTGSGARRRGNGCNSHHRYQTPSKRQYGGPGNPTLNNNQNPKTTSNVQCHIQLLNCAKNKPATLAAFHSFASQPECLFFCLQEPWCGPNKSPPLHPTPPLHPNFNLFTPTPLSPKCATYIRCNKGLSAHTTFTYKDSFISTHISLSEAVKFTLYNFYSPGHPKSLASLRDDFRPSLPCILLGDFNAHHEWWYGQLADSTSKARAFHAHRGFSKIIVDRLEDNNFTLQILRGPDPFPSPKGSPKHSDRSLFLRRNDISIYTYLDNKPRFRV
jgi:hypothetical protein